MSNTQVTAGLQNFSADDIKKLKEIVDEGCVVMQEIDDMKESLKSTVKTISEEVGIKPAQLTKAINICFKNSLHEEQAKLDEIIDIIDAVGRG
jgi:division protein CdvB (Snf7/Vps24/ESCRT-III family)